MAEGFLLQHSPFREDLVGVVFVRLQAAKLSCYEYPSGHLIAEHSLTCNHLKVIRSSSNAHKFYVTMSCTEGKSASADSCTCGSHHSSNHSTSGLSSSDECSSNLSEGAPTLHRSRSISTLEFSASTKAVRDRWVEAIMTWKRHGWKDPVLLQAIPGCDEIDALHVYIKLRNLVHIASSGRGCVPVATSSRNLTESDRQPHSSTCTVCPTSNSQGTASSSSLYEPRVSLRSQNFSTSVARPGLSSGNASGSLRSFFSRIFSSKKPSDGLRFNREEATVAKSFRKSSNLSLLQSPIHDSLTSPEVSPILAEAH